jgi:hypothetical protein
MRRTPRFFAIAFAIVFLACSASAEQTQNPRTCPQLKELSFTTDFANWLRDHKSDYKDGGTPYTKPDWTKAGKNNPIVHKRAIKIALTITYTCDASSAGTYTLEGKSTKGETLHFGPKDVTFVVGDNVVALEAAQALPNAIDDNAGDSIDWTLNGHCKETTGPHQIYVTEQRPYGSMVTEWRVAYVTKVCDGNTTGDECAKDIHDTALSYTLAARPKDLWSIAVGTKGECIHLVRFYILGMKMLGWNPPGTINFIYPLPARKAKATAGENDAWVAPDGRTLKFKDTNGGRNNWEAALLYNGKYYAGGSDIFATPQECMNKICQLSYLSPPYEPFELW